MAKSKFLIILSFIAVFSMQAKNNTLKYIIYFKDKTFDTNVKALFNTKAIQQRNRFNIPFDERDYPVNANYIEQLKQNNAIILHTTNWLNAALIRIDDKKLATIAQFPFIASIVKIETAKSHKNTMSVSTQDACVGNEDELAFEDQYTSSFPQVNLLHGEYLHEQGFNGENMTIAVCDNGFYNVYNNPAYAAVMADNRLLGTYDFVNNDSTVHDDTNGKHGTNCFSFIAGKKDSQYIGTATKSSYYLFQTENNNSERLQEEFNLASALERCNQLGVDVVSISLGYTTFDLASENHDTTDLRNNSTPAAKAVNMASSKGILVCVAAGNEGLKPWKYISTPSDADSAFCIASVDINGVVAGSSAYGLPNDARVKPNVAAMGVSAKYLNDAGNVSSGGGTSYATPQLAGLAACLWQAFPTKTNWEIKTAIEQSASQYLTPDKRIGYGIPDFKKAYDLLANPTFVSTKSIIDDIHIFPNPFQNILAVQCNGNANLQSIQLMNSVGQMVYSAYTPTNNMLDFSYLSTGMYLLQITTDKGVFIKKIIKE